MNDTIRLDTEEVGALAVRLARVADQLDGFAFKIRTVDFAFPDMPYEQSDELYRERRRIQNASELAAELARKVLRVQEMYENCEMDNARTAQKILAGQPIFLSNSTPAWGG